MSYDPDRHHRRTIRLHGYDYTSSGAYFVTLCTLRLECLFGEIVDGQIALNEYGRVAQDERLRTAEVRHDVWLDEFVVMPNHVHGIVILVNADSVGATRRVAPAGAAPKGPPPGSLDAIIAQYKAATTRRINRLRAAPGLPVWQRNYFEHIIRNDRSLNAIREYVQRNPGRWAEDRENPAHARERRSRRSVPL